MLPPFRIQLFSGNRCHEPSHDWCLVFYEHGDQSKTLACCIAKKDGTSLSGNHKDPCYHELLSLFISGIDLGLSNHCNIVTAVRFKAALCLLEYTLLWFAILVTQIGKYFSEVVYWHEISISAWVCFHPDVVCP